MPPIEPRRRTALELAREHESAPRTFGDLTAAETLALEQKWAKDMKPILLAAAQEKRKLRQEDLAQLDTLPNGRGMALDDVLDFLLSPAGLPLQHAIERAFKPDHRVDPFASEIDLAAAYDRPAKDSFEAAMRNVFAGALFDVERSALATVIVRELGKVTGNNGRIDESAVAKVPTASALYSRISQLAGTGALANPTPGEKLVGMREDDATLARIGRSIDLAPILARMDGFHEVAAQLAAGQPLKGAKVVAIQHLLPSFAGVLDALDKAGVAKEDVRLIGKSYSTVDEVYAWAVAHGYDVHPSSIGGDAKSVEARLLEAAKDTLEDMFAGIDPTTSKERFLLADEGGKLVVALHKHFPEYAHLCAGFEHTARGIQVLRELEAEGYVLQCPVVNMAQCALKTELEAVLIGENIVFDSLRHLDELKLPWPKTVSVLGYGAVGEQVARALRARGIEVVAYDPRFETDAAMKAQAIAAGVTPLARDEAIGAGDMVVGCSGKGALDDDDYPTLKDGAVLVNGASGNHELGTHAFGNRGGRWFREVAFEADKLMIVDGQISALFQGARVQLGSGDLGSAAQHRIMKDKRTGKEALVLRSGHVVNLGRDLPPEYIQLTRALVFASLLQASQEKRTGIIDLDATMQKAIEDAVRAHLARLGLSLDEPDFGSLAPWHL